MEHDTRTSLRETFRRHDIEEAIILAGTFRSGSTYLAQLFQANGLAGMGKERFNKALHLLKATPEDIEGYFAHVLAPFSGQTFITKMMGPHRSALARIFGYSHADARDFASQFPNAKWLYIYRDDVMAQAVSFWRARTTNRWHVFDSTPEPEAEYSFPDLLKSLNELLIQDRLWRNFFEMSGVVPWEIRYEDLLKAPKDHLRSAFDYLGVQCPDALNEQVKLKRQRDDHSAAILSRFLEDLHQRAL